ncbi:toxin-antitoxin system YwqK family antitoxin [Pseudomonas luteola]
MKKQWAIAAILVMSLTGCGEDVLDWRNASVSGGKIYASNENKPFSGFLTNVPENSLPFNDAFNDLLVKHNRTMERIGERQHVFFGRHLICDTSVKDGLLIGKTSCRDGAGATRWKATLYGKGLDGIAEIYDKTGQRVLTRNEYSQGVADGKLEIISSNTGKAVLENNSKKGLLEGEQTIWHEKTEAKIYHAEARNGKYIGMVEEWSPEGKLIGQTPYSSNGIDGEVKVWSPVTGKQIALATYVQNQKIGRATRWDEQGIVISDGYYDAQGVFTPIEMPSSNDVVKNDLEDEWGAAVKPVNKKCVDEWIDYAHKVDGEDSIIGVENMKEWDGMCSDGQHPPA